jgi:hypothetical protein
MSVTPITVPDGRRRHGAAHRRAVGRDHHAVQPYVLVAGAGRARPASWPRAYSPRARSPDRISPTTTASCGQRVVSTFTVKATENLRNRVRRALAGIDLPEGEEPQIVNYHAMAAQVLDRYGILAGIEPGQRVLSQAQRVELAGRVLDEMTFDHVKTEWQPSVVDKILNLDAQAQNHLVEPDTIVEF